MNASCKSIVMALLPLVASVASAQTPAEPAPAAPPPTAAPAKPAPATPPAEAAPAKPSAAAAHDEAGAGVPLDVSFLVGARGRNIDGSADKFQEYGTVDEGFLLESLRTLYQRPGTGDFLELGIRDATQDDESYRLSLGRQGRYRLFAEYDAIPHRFTGGTLLFGGVGTHQLRIADAVQTSLQGAEVGSGSRAAPPGPFDPSPAADLPQQTIVRGVYDGANDVTFRVDRRRAGAGLEFALGRNALAWARVSHEDREGARVISSGTYERFAQTALGVHTGDRFLTAGQDLAEPLNYRTLGVSAGVGLHREAWLADLEYTLTRFRNTNDVLLWDNPFRITNAEATNLAGTAPANGNNRGRFATGHVGLPPDSLSHEIAASAGLDLPLHGRLAASVSYGIITQDQAFEPFTLNTAVLSSRGPDVSAATLALPQRDLDGDVRTIAASLSASVRPVAPVTLGARYRLYRYDARSDEILFPGYSAFGDSFWRTVRNDPGQPVRNEVFDYWRHEADLGVDYRVSRMLSVGVETGWEGWRYDKLRVDKLDEYFAGASFALRPMRNTSLKARYRFSDRTNEGYLRGASRENPEARGLLNYNWADRRRHLADARVQYAPTRTISLGILGRFVDEDYGGDTEGGTVLDEFRFGRTDVRSFGGALDVTVTPAERLAVYASYGYEYRKEQMANAAKDEAIKSTFPDPVVAGTTLQDQFSPVNYWNSDITNVVNTVSVGATFQILPERLVLDTRYSLSFSDMDVDTFNPNPAVASGQFTTLDNAIAQDWPTIKSRLHEVTADLTYRFTPHIRTGIRYLFQEYDLDDFAWDDLGTYMAGLTPENSTRYLFADATYNAYRAHVGTIYLAGSF